MKGFCSLDCGSTIRKSYLFILVFFLVRFVLLFEGFAARLPPLGCSSVSRWKQQTHEHHSDDRM